MKHNTPLLIISFFVVIVFTCTTVVAAQDRFDADVEAIINDLPQALQDLYVNIGSDVQPAAFDDFDMSEAPWKFCFSDSYQGNAWRVAVRTEFERLVSTYQEVGLVSDYLFENANNDVDLQNAHILEFIDEGCDVIFSIPSSTGGHDEAIEAAYQAGIPFITGEGAVTSPYAMTVTSNFYRWGYDMGVGIAEQLGGQGNVMLVEGLQDHNIVLLQRQGVEDAFAEYPDITILGAVNGDWTPDVTKSALRDVLGLIQEPVDAVWTTGSEARFVAEAFEELGLPLPLITASISGDALGYWQQHEDTFLFYGHGNLPATLAEGMFKTGVRVLLGQTPKLNIVVVPLPEVTQETLADWYESCMDSLDVTIFPIPPTDPVSDDILDPYFENGEAIPHYDYSTTPSACSGREEE